MLRSLLFLLLLVTGSVCYANEGAGLVGGIGLLFLIIGVF